ncbi:MAG: hypothetical protein AAGA21_24555 [Pseudomonadota bacterium]
MRKVISTLVCLAALSPMASPAVSEEGGGEKIFASEWIEPSETGQRLIDAVFKGQITPLPKIRQDTLDKALKQGDWATMDAARQSAAGDHGAMAVLDWSATRHLAGYLGASSRYGLDLYSIGKATSRPDLMEASVGVFFYLYGVTLIDGHKCTDPSSPEAVMNKTVDAYAPVRAFAATLSQVKMDQAIEYATAFEKLVAPDRASDPMVCVHGKKRLEQIVAINDDINATLNALKQREKERAEHGEVRTELPTRQPPSWIKPEQEWLKAASDARGSLPAWLLELGARLTGR